MTASRQTATRSTDLPGSHTCAGRSALLAIQMLGGFQVWLGDQEIAPTAWRLRKASHLIKLLALTPNHRCHREQIYEYLWPDLDPTAAANNLRVTVHFARKLLDHTSAPGINPLQFRGEHLVLCPDQRIEIDVDRFELAASEARDSHDPAAYAAALELYTGELLPEDRFEDWTIERRESLHATRLGLLHDLAALYEQRGDMDDTIAAWQRVVESDPCHEPAHAALMRLYARSGRRVQAARQYQKLLATLQEQLDIEPDHETTRLYETILTRAPHEQVSILNGHTLRPATSDPEAAARGSTSTPKTNLPVPLTSLVDRRQDIADLCRTIQETRLLTLVGPGGSGKTRLAIETARKLIECFPDGVWFVELDGVRDPSLVEQTVAAVLGVREMAGRSMFDILADAMHGKRLLLVLDNCEHLIEASALLARKLLQDCPLVTTLVTSREALQIDGEVIWPVSPLAVPDPCQVATQSELQRIPSVQLFIDRATLVRPAFALTDDNAPSVAMICRQLEGMPLAIELAATRVRALTVRQIADRLSQSLTLLAAESRSRPSRQRSLRAAIDWSYDLLADEEQRLFRQLAVFAGGFTLDAAESVCGDDIDRASVLDLLFQLVDKSLLMVSDRNGEVLYRLLEPIRQYAEERLSEAGELHNARDRHLDWMVELTTKAEPALSAAGQDVWLNRLESEHDNVRAALAWSIETRDADRGLAVGWRLWRFWSIRGHFTEGRNWLAALLDLSVLPSINQGEALFGAGRLAYLQGDTAAARRWFNQCLAIADSAEHDELKAGIVTQLGHILFREGDYGAARAYYEAGLRIRQETNAQQRNADPWYLGVSLTGIGKAALALGNHQIARARLEESLDRFREVGDNVEIARTLCYLGQVAHLSGDLARARQLQEQSLELARCLDNQHVAGDAVTNLGYIAVDEGDDVLAGAYFTEAITLWAELGIRTGIIECLEGLARLAARQQRYPSAIRMAAAAGSARAASGQLALPYLGQLLVSSLEPAYRAVGDRAAALEDEGRAMTLDQAIAHSLTSL